MVKSYSYLSVLTRTMIVALVPVLRLSSSLLRHSKKLKALPVVNPKNVRLVPQPFKVNTSMVKDPNHHKIYLTNGSVSLKTCRRSKEVSSRLISERLWQLENLTLSSDF